MREKIFKIIILVILFAWMITIFCFSNQASTVSKKNSGRVIQNIIDVIPKTKNLDKKQKDKIVEKMQPIVRKSAHFFIYTMGGAILIITMTIVVKNNKNKEVIAFLIGASYAITDEVHQIFISGRSMEFRDILIDSTGVLIGITFGIIALKAIKNTIKIKK
ncbi:MAG: VanZ family protein [Clostridia bacterium]